MALVSKDKKNTKIERCKIKSTEDEEAIPSDCLKCLKTFFGHSDFRPKQWKVISSILNERRDNCFFTPSGYGKSLAYQFPLVYTDSIGIVVTPLISLMQDQVREMRSNYVSACYLGSAQENQDTLVDVIDCQYNIVYVTPEYITGSAGEYLLGEIGDKISLIAIDEAHCISKWGHDFRSSYCDLHWLRRFCRGVPIIALTATATTRVTEDIINGLKLRIPQIIRTSVDRPNLYFSVKPKSKIYSLNRFEEIAPLIWNDIGPYIRQTRTGSTIVHCITKKMTEIVANVIQCNGYDCGFYHSGVPLQHREETQEDFISGRIRFICSTVAFGMGINKLDVRLVILYGAPADLESFYQKVGRAGRDGLPAKCLLFYNDNDLHLHALMRSTDCDYTDQEVIARKEKLIDFMMEYVCDKVCRRRYILSYFGENCDKLQTRPDCCDICEYRS